MRLREFELPYLIPGDLTSLFLIPGVIVFLPLCVYTVLEQQERAEPHWSPSNECVGIYGEKFKQLLEWAERKARERAERDQNEQKTDALHNAFSFGNPSS